MRQVPLKVELTKTPFKYLESLDRPTKDRIIGKLKEMQTPLILAIPSPYKELTSDHPELGNTESCLRLRLRQSLSLPLVREAKSIIKRNNARLGHYPSGGTVSRFLRSSFPWSFLRRP